MKLLIIDAQGGGLGKGLIALIREERPQDFIVAVGTNSEATNAMRKAGADVSATGENPVIVNSRNANVIIGPIGIVIADSLYGEVTAQMANAVARSNAIRLLIPVNKCENIIVGIQDINMGKMLQQVVDRLNEIEKDQK